MAERRYKAWGETRYTWGTTPSTYRYTGQRQEEGLGLYQMGARWVDPALGRWLSPDTIVPDPVNPQSFNRYSYVRNNPLRYIDPTGNQDEEPPPGVSEEEHERLLTILAEAQRLSGLVEIGDLTSVEALALLLEYAEGINTFDGETNWDNVVSDLGLVVGGIRRSGLFGWDVELTHREASPYNQYYVGGRAFNTSGFRSEFFDDPTENQVRHFTGGIVGGTTIVERAWMLAQEPDPGDDRLYRQAFILAGDMAVIEEQEGVGNWILRNLATEEVQSHHEIRQPDTCLGSFLPAYLVGVLVVISVPCFMITRTRRRRTGGAKYMGAKRRKHHRRTIRLLLGSLLIIGLVTCAPLPFSDKTHKDISLEQARALAPFEICLPSWLPPEVKPVPLLTYHEELGVPGPPVETYLYAEYSTAEGDKMMELRQAYMPPDAIRPKYSPDMLVERLLGWQLDWDWDSVELVEPEVVWTSSMHQDDGLIYNAVEITTPHHLHATLITWSSEDVDYFFYSQFQLATTLESAKSVSSCEIQEFDDEP